MRPEDYQEFQDKGETYEGRWHELGDNYLAALFLLRNRCSESNENLNIFSHRNSSKTWRRDIKIADLDSKVCGYLEFIAFALDARFA